MVSLPADAYGSAPPAEGKERPRPTRRPAGRGGRRRRRFLWWATAALNLAALGALAVFEMRTSSLQSVLFARFGDGLTYRVAEGPSASISFPTEGPYNHRLGYAGMPEFIDGLRGHGYRVERQAEISDRFAWYLQQGGFAPYKAKSQAGLTLLDRDGAALFTSELWPILGDGAIRRRCLLTSR